MAVRRTPTPQDVLAPGGFNVTKVLLPVLIVLLVAAAFLIGVLWTKVSYLQKGAAASPANTAANAPAQAPKVTVSQDQIKGLFDKDLVKFGDKNRKVLFVEVADPSCPYCHIAGGYDPELSKQVNPRFQYVSDGGTYAPPVIEMEKLIKAGKASFVWVYTPGHGNGEMGTKALYCANEKGKFWEVHNKLMTKAGYELLNTQVKNDKAKSGEVAAFLSSVFSQKDMKACLDSGKYDARLSSDVQVATSLGVQGTPGFFVNTNAFNGAYSWTDMKSVVDAALK